VTTARKIILDPNLLGEVLRTIEQPLVFTNGCFDILHRGHVAYLEEAADLGATLLVALNSDESIQRLGKEPDRPVNALEDRMALVAALECVDLVTAFDQDTPLELIQRIQPKHLVKGGDWLPENIVGADIVKANGGVVHSIRVRYQHSTTDLLRKLRRVEPQN
tara:strand:- start:422 stop:910 length:489 start_codon:yes stop_codon:yes gene_type:complete